MAEPDPRTVVVALLRAAAPERARDLSAFLAEYDPAVEMTRSGPAEMKAGRERIAFNNDMLDAVWLYTFSAWQAIKTYAPAVVVSLCTGSTVDAVLKFDEDLGPLEQAYKARMAIATTYATVAGADGRGWPDDVPRPTENRESLDVQGRAAFDLASIAVAAILLHETRHVRFANDGLRPDDEAEEEMACDVFARSFLTERVGEYCADSREPFDRVMAKRAMGLAMASIVVHGLTPKFARWGSASYPSVGDRLDALIGNVAVAPDDNFWLVAASLLTGVMRQDHRPVDLVCTDARQLTGELIGLLK
jgi:hypothetical protein